MPIPDTSATPAFVAYPPDWSKTVQHRYAWSTSVTEARSGREQRASKRRYPQRVMEYTLNGLTEFDSLNLNQVRRDRTRAVLKTPWWPEGQRISNTQPDANTLTLETIPLGDEFFVGGEIYLGGLVREIATVVERNLTLVPMAATAQPAGAWVYPVRVCLQESGETAIKRNRPAGADELMIFRTL